MKLVIIGANGQLGQDCHTILGDKHKISCCDVQQIDITQPEQVAELFHTHKPEAIVNCAAYTAVDKCETEQEACRAVNAYGPQLLAEQCQKYGTRLIHISTDYVYDGKRPAPEPYLEGAATEPLSMYGKTKLEGDMAVSKIDNHVILRTAWLYGFGGPNFLKTMLRLAVADSQRLIRVVNDQYGSLTWSWSLAKQIEALLESDITGVVHASAEGYSTWYEGARYFLDQMGVEYTMEPCTTADYPTPAARPANSILENSRLKQAGINVMVDWRQDVDRFVSRYKDALLDEAKKQA